jgi:arabinogalactan endo-1,4-beta-galactosidase
VLKEAIRALRMHDYEKPVALHLGKWWDLNLTRSYLYAMDEFNVEYEIICFSFYPTMFGATFNSLRQLSEIAKEKEKSISIAEYAYPSRSVKGQFWFMNKPSPGYQLTQRDKHHGYRISSFNA